MTTTTKLDSKRVESIASKIVAGALAIDAVRSKLGDDAAAQVSECVAELKAEADGQKPGKSVATTLDVDTFIMECDDASAEFLRKLADGLTVRGKRFSTGSYGFNGFGKVACTVAGQPVKLQVTLNAVVIGSKPQAE